MGDGMGLVENLSLGLSWGLFDIANGNPEAPDTPTGKTHNDKSDMMVNANLSYGFDALGGKLTPSIDVTLNRLDNEKSQVDTVQTPGAANRGDPDGRTRHEVEVHDGDPPIGSPRSPGSASANVAPDGIGRGTARIRVSWWPAPTVSPTSRHLR